MSYHALLRDAVLRYVWLRYALLYTFDLPAAPYTVRVQRYLRTGRSGSCILSERSLSLGSGSLLTAGFRARIARLGQTPRRNLWANPLPRGLRSPLYRNVSADPLLLESGSTLTVGLGQIPCCMVRVDPLLRGSGRPLTDGFGRTPYHKVRADPLPAIPNTVGRTILIKRVAQGRVTLTDLCQSF
jgi:hypothetical protein